MFTVVELEHPPPSVTVTVYVFGASAFCVAPVNPPGDQAYVNVPVPPVAETVAEPLLAPKQVTFEEFVTEILGPLFVLTVAFPVAVHPLASLTTTL
jgi:hypothetical protein